MNAIRNFRIYLSFCLLECVIVAVSVEPHSKIKGKQNLADNPFIEMIWPIRLQTDSLKHVRFSWRNSLYISSNIKCRVKGYAHVFRYILRNHYARVYREFSRQFVRSRPLFKFDSNLKSKLIIQNVFER